MRRSLVVLALVAVIVPQPARAELAGCEVFATGYPGTSGGCRYIATGPGAYEVQTVSGYIVSASSDGGKTFRTLASQSGSPNQVNRGIAVATGPLDTKAGDIVVAAINYQKIVGPPVDAPDPLPDVPAQSLTYQDGHIKAGDV